ncbi:MAG TPA: SpoIIE family protein phosphatase [Roseiflexaceae bacterium]|nr:SpoIIE family protein phosphatase [Roseiflexaceae bacterium]
MPLANHTATICVVLGEHISNYYTGPLVRGAVAAASRLGCRLIFYSPFAIHLTSQTLGAADMPLLPHGADAYLLPAYVTSDVVAACTLQGAAVAVYSGSYPGLPTVGPDNLTAGQAATTHLIAHGRRRIVHLLGLADSQEAADRHAGYQQALAEAGIAYDSRLVVRGDFQIQASDESIERLVQQGVDFDAVFAANDMAALGALRALRRTGRHVADEVAVVGFDDALVAAAAEPPLTTMRQAPFQIGWVALHALMQALEGTPLPPRITVPSQLVIRESCGCDTDTRAMSDLERLADQLGGLGAPLETAMLQKLTTPIETALAGGEPEAALGQAIEEIEHLGWRLPALFGVIERWHAATGQHAAAAAATATLARLLTARNERNELDRTQRINMINYVIDMLRSNSGEQSVDAALRYIAGGGRLVSVSAQRGNAPDTISAQRIVRGRVEHWHGPATEFPPAAWLVSGEALLLMPLETSTQQRMLVGAIERAGLHHLDLDDLLLRSINTYRSITVLHDTLRELDAARSVQLSLLPRSAPSSDEYDIAGATQPARQVGGDLYGYYVRPSGALALAVGDVAGKGMPAALLMSACATALAGSIPSGMAPSPTLGQIHQMLRPSVGRGQNAAICLVYLDGAQVRIANAGAIAPLVRTAAGVRLIDIGGLPLGTPLSALTPYTEAEIELAPGDMLILSSDGIVEAVNSRGEMYGFDRFAAAIEQGPGGNAQAMLSHLFADVAAFIGDAEVRDDMAAVVAYYAPRNTV